MTAITLAGGAIIDVASGEDVAQSTENTVERILGARSTIPIQLRSSASCLVPAAAYASGIRVSLCFQEPASARLQIVRCVSVYAVDMTTRVYSKLTAEPRAHFCIGGSGIGSGIVGQNAPFDDVVAPFVDDKWTPDQRILIEPRQKPYLFIYGAASITYTNPVMYVATLTVSDVPNGELASTL